MVENANWFFPYQWEFSEVRLMDTWSNEPQPLRDPLLDFNPATVDPFYEQIKIAGV